jgi:hypothetical protein
MPGNAAAAVCSIARMCVYCFASYKTKEAEPNNHCKLTHVTQVVLNVVCATQSTDQHKARNLN